MSITVQELSQFKDDLLNGLKDTFNEGKKVFDKNGNELHLTGNRSERNAYFDALFEQNKGDKLAEIERQMSAIKGNTGLAAQKLKELAEEKERIENGGISKGDLKRYRQQKLVKTVGAIAEIGKGIVDIIVAIGNKNIEITRANYEKNTKIIQANLEVQSKLFAQGMKNIVGGFQKNSNDLSFDMTKSSYDLVQSYAKSSMDVQIAQKTYQKDVKAANVKATGAIIGAGAAIGAAVGSIIPGIGTAAGAIVGGIIGAIGGLFASSYTKISELDIKRKELDIQLDEKIKGVMDQSLSSFHQITDSWDNLYKETSDFVLKFNAVSKRFSATIGFTNEKLADTIMSLSQVTVGRNKSLVQIFGDEIEKIPEYMDSYISSSGRAVGLSAKDSGNIMATGRLFGMSGQESSQLYGSMNIFNTSISSASDSMSVMYHQITRMGLSTKKFGKDLVQNLKLAQKYNFKGGVDNMMKLTKWAQQTRFNLNSAASFADSILDSTLSDALEKSAKLQVLGGAAAIYSDPLGMLYDAGANVGDLARRQAAMFSDISGTFNAKTGETEFSWYENKMIRERAKAAGLNVEDVFNQIRQTNKQGVIDKLLDGMDEEDRIAIGNRATYNKKKGRWEVTDIRGETHDIQDYKNNKANIEDLLPKDTQESMLVVAEKSLAKLEEINNQLKENQTKLGIENKSKIFETINYEANKLKEYYNNYWNDINQGFNMAREHSKNMFDLNMSLMKNTIIHSEVLRDAYEGFEMTMANTISTFTDYNSFFRKALYEFGLTGAEGMNQFIKSEITGKSDEYLLWTLQHQTNFRSNRNRIDFTDFNDVFNNTPNAQAHTDAMLNDIIRSGITLQNDYPDFNTYQTIYGEAAWDKYNKAVQKYNEAHPVDVSHGLGYRYNGSVEDGIISNNGAVRIRTNKTDQYLAAMPDGPIDKILNQLIPGLQALLNGNGGSGDVNLNLNGRLELSQDGSSVNLVDIIKNNPSATTQLVALLAKAAEVNKNGRAVRNHMIS